MKLYLHHGYHPLTVWVPWPDRFTRRGLKRALMFWRQHG